MQSFVFVGVGGSGGKTLAYLWRALDRRLRAAGWTEDMPKIWQFLHFDPRAENDAPGEDIPTLPPGAVRYYGLGQVGRNYLHYDDDLRQGASLAGFASWRPRPPEEVPPPYLGAGQRRAVGRVVGLAEIKTISNELRRAFVTVNDDTAKELRMQLKGVFNTPADYETEHACQVVLVGSLAGGSGSGMFLDVNHVIRGLRGDFDGKFVSEHDPLTVLYTSELFQDLREDWKEGVDANTLAATCELLAAAEGNLDPRTVAILNRAGVRVPPAGSRRVGNVVALVGKSSSTLNLRSELDAYRMVGSLLAAAVTDHRFQKHLSSFVVNTVGDTYRNGLLPLSRNALPERAGVQIRNVAGALGYASFGLGRHLFAQYAAERLAKAAVDRLLGGHRRMAEAGVSLSEDALIRKAADSDETEFFDNSGLHERGRAHNQVLDALRHKEVIKGLLDDFVRGGLDKLRPNVSRMVNRDEAARDVGQEFDSREAALEASVQQHRDARLVEWVGDVRVKLIRAVTNEIARFGFPTTLELLARLEAQIGEAIAELEAEAATTKGQAGAVLKNVREVLEKITKSPVLDEAGAGRRKAAWAKVEGELLAFTAARLRDVRTDLLQPLRSALKKAAADLEHLVTVDGLEKQRYDKWPERSVPRALLPAPNEYLLEKPDTFPDTFEALLARLFDQSVGTALDRALIEVVTGMWPDVSAPTVPQAPSLVSVHTEWVPQGMPAARSARGSFQLTVEPFQILNRAQTWVERRATVAQYVRQSLRAYLAEDVPERGARIDAFAEALASALSAAQPLARFDDTVNQAIHQVSPALSTAISSLPVSPVSGDQLFDKVATVVLAAKLAEFATIEEIRGLCDDTSTESVCEVFTFTGKTRHPAMLASLLEPVRAEWQRRQSAGDARIAQFWGQRRATILPDFVPLPYEVQRALARGWCTSVWLGYVRDVASPDGPTHVWDLKEGWLPFPWPYLTGRETDPGRVFHRLFESFPLALLDLSGGVRTTMFAYKRLVDLGSPGAGGDPTAYTALNGELASWLDDGSLPSGRPGGPGAPLEEVAGPAGAEGGEGRKAALVAVCDGNLAYYHQLAEPESSALTGEVTFDPLWEIKPLMVGALEDLRGQLAAHVVSTVARSAHTQRGPGGV